MKVLLDASVVRHAIRRYPTLIDHTVEWGGVSQTRQLHALKPRKEQQPWLEEQIRALSAIAEAARDGRLKLFLADELRLEARNRPSGYLAWGPESVFAGIPFDSVSPPFWYSRIISSYLDSPGDADKRWSQFLDQAHDKDFALLKSALGGNKNADALHILTAERASLDFFLTTDKKLANIAARQRRLPLRVRVVIPTELVSLLAPSAGAEGGWKGQ